MKQRNSSFFLTCDQAFSFSEKVLFPLPPNKREEGPPDRRLRFVLIFSHPAEELRGCYCSEKVERLFVQSSECDERIESFASPPYFITLLNLIVNVFCAEQQWNLDTTNLCIRKSSVYRTIFFTPVTAKYMKKNLDITKPRYSQQILPVPWGSTVLTEDTVFMSPTGDGTDDSASLEQRRGKAVPSQLSCFKY